MATTFKYATLLLFVFWALGTQLLKTDGVIHLFLIIAIYASVLAYSSERAWKQKKTHARSSNQAEAEVCSPAKSTVIFTSCLWRRDDYSAALVSYLQPAVLQHHRGGKGLPIPAGNAPHASESLLPRRAMGTSLYN